MAASAGSGALPGIGPWLAGAAACGIHTDLCVVVPSIALVVAGGWITEVGGELRIMLEQVFEMQLLPESLYPELQDQQQLLTRLPLVVWTELVGPLVQAVQAPLLLKEHPALYCPSPQSAWHAEMLQVLLNPPLLE